MCEKWNPWWNDPLWDKWIKERDVPKELKEHTKTELIRFIEEARTERDAFRREAERAWDQVQVHLSDTACARDKARTLKDAHEALLRGHNNDAVAYQRTIADLRADLAAARALLRRYRNETPLGHQPHMIAHEVDALLVRIDAALKGEEK